MEKPGRSDEDHRAPCPNQPDISSRACRSVPTASLLGTFVGYSAAVDQAHKRHRRSQARYRLEPWRSVKPSAQPTLVRTQHLPPL